MLSGAQRAGEQGLFKAEVTAGFTALEHDKIRQSMVALMPGFADESGGSSAGDDGRDHRGAVLRYSGSDKGIPAPGDHRVHTGVHRGANSVSILGGSDHGVDGDKAVSPGQREGLVNLFAQSPQVGRIGMPIKSGSR